MKKVLSTILMVAMLVSFCGCCQEDHKKPTGAAWDVSNTSNWETWAQGKIVNITENMPKSCTNGPGCSNHKSVISYGFPDGKTISLCNIRNPGTISIGQTGTLYKYVRNSQGDKRAWFQWIQDKDVPITPVKETISVNEPPNALRIDIPNAIRIEKETVKLHSWKNYPKESPERYQIVLLRLKTGVITTGHLNHINEWKSETNKEETVRDVASWKKIDLN